jgi:hypothetical protein
MTSSKEQQQHTGKFIHRGLPAESLGRHCNATSSGRQHDKLMAHDRLATINLDL